MFILVQVLRFDNSDEANEYADENLPTWNKIVQYEDEQEPPYVVECHSYITHGATLH